MIPIWGRERELRLADSFVGSIQEGPAVLVLEGEPGIGKTTLWQAVTASARAKGLSVLISRPAEPEAKLAYAALGDLLTEVGESELQKLPRPQRQALEAALLRADPAGHPADPRAISMAVLLVLRSLAAKQPLLLAIDDWQWIDRPTARVVAFACRRLSNEQTGVLVTARQGVQPEILGRELDWPEHRRHLIVVGPLTLAALHRLIVERLEVELPRPLLARLHVSCRGNPFYGLEIARAIASSGSVPGHGDPLPLPAGLAQALQARLTALPTPALRALAVIAASTRPTSTLVRLAVGASAATKGLQSAMQAGIVQAGQDGRLRFTHPMLGSLVAVSGSHDERRRLHRQLADLANDDEERAIHLARGDPTTSDLLSIDAGARSAWLRGAPEIAAELSERGLALATGASANELHRRRLQTAEYHFRAGQDLPAKTLLETAVSEAPGPIERATARWQLGWVLRHSTSLAAGLAAFSEALQDLEAVPCDDTRLRATIERDLALVLINMGRRNQAAPHAAAAMELATLSGDARLRNDAIGPLVLIEFLSGRGVRHELVAQASDGISSEHLPVGLRTNNLIALTQKWSDQFDLARRRLETEYRAAVERGAEADLPSLLWSLSELECWTGKWALSAQYAQKGVEVAMLSGGPHDRALTLCARAFIGACRGDIEQAYSDAVAALRAAEQSGLQPASAWSRHALGFLELSRGDPSAAHSWMAPVSDHVAAMGNEEPGAVRFVPDEIEALVGVGDIEKAITLLETFEERAHALNRTWALATGARCRGLIRAVGQDLDGAAEALEEALAHHQNLGIPLELGRTLLQLGRIHRRRREKRLAKQSLDAALTIFDALPAPLWSAQAQRDLDRIGMRPAASDGLSPTESAVARLAAQGKTNRDIASNLFLSPKSVDGVMLRIYDKLGIRSRAELASWMAAHKDQ
jgi:DNA-binding CsgD family transcriptional regulator